MAVGPGHLGEGRGQQGADRPSELCVPKKGGAGMFPKATPELGIGGLVLKEAAQLH